MILRKLLYTDIKNFVESLSYKLIDKNYINARSKLILKDNEGYFLNSSLDNLKHGYIPMRFHKNNPYTIKNIKHWLKLNNKLFELVSNEYINSSKLLKWKCLKEDCNDYFYLSWDCVLADIGCGVCAGRQVGLSNCLATKNPKLASEWHSTLNGELTPYDVTYGSGIEVWWKCKDCGHEWHNSVNNRNCNNTGCPECNKSKGEKECSVVLISKGFIEINNKKLSNVDNAICFITQKEFKGLIGVGGGLLSYDFYIPDLNLLIEYQGIQHEKYIPGFHKSYDAFETQIEHDKRKRKYAQINNINLLEIWYYDFDNIENILTKELNIISYKLQNAS